MKFDSVQAVRDFLAPHRRAVVAVAALVLALVGSVPAQAAAPPTSLNYQGVLRDIADRPLTNTVDIVFAFMDAASAGNEIMQDQHTVANGNAVSVSNGLLNVALGSGTVVDGSGPGTYISLDAVFRDYGSVWLELRVNTETLSPRTQIRSSAYALNATNLVGHPDSYFLDTSSSTQQKSGELDVISSGNLGVHAESSGGYGLVAVGPLEAVSGSSPNGRGGSFSGNPGIFAVSSNGWGAWIQNGMHVSALGLPEAGHFEDTDSGTFNSVDLATTQNGITATGQTRGGYFTDAGGDNATLAVGGYGMEAMGGTTGGRFTDAGGDTATLASGGVGISAGGPLTGAYLYDGAPYSSYAYIPYYDLGIDALGSTAGGRFRNFGTSAYAYLGISSYKIQGSGSVSFVQNHPSDPSKVIVYAAPEGDEVAVYTRGSGRLVNGEGRVTLGETFALVANPDIGLTATATPRGGPIAISVAQVSPSELVVQGPAGSDAEFDYMVWGLRIGFEEQSIVQPKKDDSKIPSMHDHEELFKGDPSLRSFTALARFKGVEEKVRGKKSLDFSRADRLRDAVGVASYKEPGGPEHDPGWHDGAKPASSAAAAGAAKGGTSGGEVLPPSPAVPAGPVEPGAAGESSSPAAGGNGRNEAPPVTVAPLDYFGTDGKIESGDVVSLSPSAPGSVIRSAGPSDSLVIGCAQPSGLNSASSGGKGDPTPASGQVAVATSHTALCHVDASYGAIAVGDRLISSPAPGMAMRADPAVAGAAILGRAIDPLPAGDGLIRVLLGAR